MHNLVLAVAYFKITSTTSQCGTILNFNSDLIFIILKAAAPAANGTPLG
jgi:hypothetical protein